MQYDYTIIGGGIVGVATALQLQQQCPHARIAVIEKESSLAFHQTGHNSGVVHAGVYYQPGSLKARFCKEGAQKTLELCRQFHLPHDQCGKLLVACNELEMERMHALFKRCQENELDVTLIDQNELKRREPHITGLGAIFVSTTAIVNYKSITEVLAQEFKQSGGDILLGHKVVALSEMDKHIDIKIKKDKHVPVRLQTGYLISCSGLMADRCAQMLGIDLEFRIIPFRGEYYQLSEKHNAIVNHLIYPIPDPDLPFLGVHLTRMIDGSVTVGPNAVLGWKREGYGAINVNLRDIKDMISYAGFWRVLKQNIKTGIAEVKNSWWKSGYLKQVQKYCPHIELKDLKPYPAGIRAQAVLADGSLVHDFLFAETPHSLHVCNAPSPAATSAMPIGAYICEHALQKSLAHS